MNQYGRQAAMAGNSPGESAADAMQYQEFRATWAQSWRCHMRPMLPLKILTLLFTWVLGYMIGKVAGSIALPVITVGGIVLYERWATAAIRVRMSPGGVEFLGRTGTIDRMPWPDIHRISVLTSVPRVIVATERTMAVSQGSVMAAHKAKEGPGLVGAAVQLSRAEARQQRAQGPWPWVRVSRQARPYGVRLAEIDRYWMQGQIGGWVRHYRPDLFAAPPGGSER